VQTCAAYGLRCLRRCSRSGASAPRPCAAWRAHAALARCPLTQLIRAGAAHVDVCQWRCVAWARARHARAAHYRLRDAAPYGWHRTRLCSCRQPRVGAQADTLLRTQGCLRLACLRPPPRAVFDACQRVQVQRCQVRWRRACLCCARPPARLRARALALSAACDASAGLIGRDETHVFVAGDDAIYTLPGWRSRS